MASSTVTSSVEVLVPSSANDEGVAVNELVLLLAPPAVNVTVAAFTTEAKLTVTVIVWATVSVIVTEHEPATVVHVVALNVAPAGLLLKVTA